MPGIFGMVSGSRATASPVEKELGAISRVMHHRPTYRVGMRSAQGFGMGRIGPCFLNPYEQPVVSSDCRFWLVFDGELYQPDEARGRLAGGSAAETDAEIVLVAIQEQGPQAISMLAGSYVGFAFDAQQWVGHLFTDRLGLRGCYYHLACDGTFAFASELKALAEAPSFRGHLDVQAASEFLNIGCPFYDRTLFEEVKFLPHGTVLTLQAGQLQAFRYWDVPRLPAGSQWRYQDALEEGVLLLKQAVKRQLRQRGRIAVMLSAGLDSRAIVGSAVAAGVNPATVTLGAGRDKESPLAARVAERLGLENRRLEIAPDYLADFGEEGMWLTDAAIPCRELYWMPHLPCIENIAQAFFSGYIGGTFLGGAGLRAPHVQQHPAEVQRQLLVSKRLGRFSPHLDVCLRPDFRRLAFEGFEQTAGQLARGMRGDALADEIDRSYLVTDGRRLTNMVFAGLWSVIADVKYPFGDYDLLDFYSRLPVEWRYGVRFYKEMIVKAFPGLVDIPCVSDTTRWLAARLDRPLSTIRLQCRKMAQSARLLAGLLTVGRLNLPPDSSKFTHDGYWYRTVPRLRGWVESILLDERTLARPYLEPEGVRKLLRLQMNRGYMFGLLSRLVTFEYFNRFFIDKEKPEKRSGADPCGSR